MLSILVAVERVIVKWLFHKVAQTVKGRISISSGPSGDTNKM